MTSFSSKNQAHSTPVASIVPEKSSKRKSFQPKQIQSTVNKPKPIAPHGERAIATDHAPDEFFQLTQLSRDQYRQWLK